MPEWVFPDLELPHPPARLYRVANLTSLPRDAITR